MPRARAGGGILVAKRPRRLLRLVDLHLVPDVVGRVGDLLAEVNRTGLVAGEERGIVAVEAVADRLHVALVALGRVLVAAMVLGPNDRVIAVDLGIACELVRYVQARVGVLA